MPSNILEPRNIHLEKFAIFEKFLDTFDIDTWEISYVYQFFHFVLYIVLSFQSSAHSKLKKVCNRFTINWFIVIHFVKG